MSLNVHAQLSSHFNINRLISGL